VKSTNYEAPHYIIVVLIFKFHNQLFFQTFLGMKLLSSVSLWIHQFLLLYHLFFITYSEYWSYQIVWLDHQYKIL